MKFQTEKRYGGFQAHVGQRVLLAAPKHDDPTKTCLHAGVIVAIAGKDDRPYIQDLRTGHMDFDKPAWTFVDCRRYPGIDGAQPLRGPEFVAAIEAMPVGSWTWCPEVW